MEAREGQAPDATKPPGDENYEPKRDARGRWLPGSTGSLAHRLKPGDVINPRGGSAQQRAGREFEALLTARIGGDALPPSLRPRLAKALGVRPSDLDGMTLGQIIIAQLGFKAAEGDLAFIREITDRILPKPRRLELTGADGAPLEVRKIAADMDVVEAAAIYEELRSDE